MIINDIRKYILYLFRAYMWKDIMLFHISLALERSRCWFTKPVGPRNNRNVHTLKFFFLSFSDMKVFALIFALCIAVSSGYIGDYYHNRYYPRYYGNSLYDDDYGKYILNYITDYHFNLPRRWRSRLERSPRMQINQVSKHIKFSLGLTIRNFYLIL